MKQDSTRVQKILQQIFDQSYAAIGPLHWWPADTDEEMIIGAVLTQNTAWKNVEQAIANLRQVGKLTLRAIHATPEEELAQLIRPTGYFNLKAKRLLSLVRFFMERCGGDLSCLSRNDPATLRRKLLEVYGIGPETADSILLYALKMPIFVVDAYTRRILSRHGLCSAGASYEEIQSLFMRKLPHEEKMFNEYHAQLVAIGNRFCRPHPLCSQCPLFKKELFVAKKDFNEMVGWVSDPTM